MNEMKIGCFYKREKYKEFLNNYMSKLSAEKDYNIYLHQIADFGMDRMEYNHSRDEILNKRVKGILKYGLLLDEYSSICGTTRLVGEAKDIDISKILGYRYDDVEKKRAVSIFAIPKYVIVDGEKVEFSSFNGVSAEECPQELRNIYRYFKSYPQPRDFKFCLLDCLKKRYMPREFLLGIQIEDIETGQMDFLDPQTHLMNLNKAEQQEFEQVTAEKIKGLYEKYQTKDLTKIITEEYREDETWVESRYEMDF